MYKVQTFKYNKPCKIGDKLFNKNTRVWYEIIDISDSKIAVIPLKAFNSWAGNNKGTPEDRGLCIESVSANSKGALPHQCNFKRGYGKDKLYCKTHAKLRGMIKGGE